MPERPTVRVEVRLYGERNFPTGAGVIPESMLTDINQLIDGVREKYPHASEEFLIRYIWTKGMDSLRSAVEAGNIPNPAKALQHRTLRARRPVSS